MMKKPQTDSRVQRGQIVFVLRGRASGMPAIVIGLAGPGYVWIADGKYHKAKKPKKKNIKHVQPTNYVVREIVDALDKFGHVDDAKLRYALNQYQLPQGGTLEGE